eukprot:CAMPEP_0118934860 /NCGR_PEP_ID=MMETSP1169-20130426/14323_1 /TAXON_ID=36882 /ORGANISM="Pyramimonas obovata, Strain CCMP722" /LENGTH=120 /DNA_ID=CAMNT_0006877807 /DNA_START=286 /DNA_END=649 /DNA_ORIENTATION=-
MKPLATVERPAIEAHPLSLPLHVLKPLCAGLLDFANLQPLVALALVYEALQQRAVPGPVVVVAWLAPVKGSPRQLTPDQLPELIWTLQVLMSLETGVGLDIAGVFSWDEAQPMCRSKFVE